MPRAPREQAVEQPPDRPAPAPVRAAALEGPAAVMFLQSTAGNQAVARSLARRALQREPASPGVDHAADASNVTITFLMRDLNLKSRDASTIDFLHEPGVSFQVAPKEAPQPVVQAALSAMNLHLQRNGKDLVELSVDPQASIGGDKPTVGAQAQAEFHVSSTFSMTASTAVEASLGSSVDLKWSPMSIGVLYKLDGSKPPPREEGKDSAYYEKIQPGRKVISWVAAQLDPSEFTPRGGGEQLSITTLVTELFDAMVASHRGEPKLKVDLGMMEEPPGLTAGLARAATLLASARPDIADHKSVLLTILKLPPDGKGTSSVVRYKRLAIDSAPVAPLEPSPVRTWGTDPAAAPTPAPSGPTIVGPSRVVPAPPPVVGVAKDGPAAAAPRTWGVGPPATP
jgi:hypothetical protein